MQGETWRRKTSLLLDDPSLRLQRILVFLGFLLVGSGNLPFVGVSDAISTNSYDFYLIVTFVGFALFGFASWAWLLALSRRQGGFREMRIALRLFAVACLVSGAAYLGLVNELVDVYRRLHHVGVRTQAIAYGLTILGFCVTALGFWTAARAAGSKETAHADSAFTVSDSATSQ